jgi:hypothetical protein
MENHDGIMLTGETEGLVKKTCPSTTSSTTNPMWTVPGANPGLRSERPLTNYCQAGGISSDFYWGKSFDTHLI